MSRKQLANWLTSQRAFNRKGNAHKSGPWGRYNGIVMERYREVVSGQSVDVASLKMEIQAVRTATMNACRRMRYASQRRSGKDMALEHFRDGMGFSRGMGGADKVVKEYFLSLRPGQLEPILTEYGQIYGSEAENYARKALPKWRSGSVTMSGMVARRLFSLLPPRMPLKEKYQLAENLWRYFGPSSQHEFTIGTNTDVDTITRLVSKRLDEKVTPVKIPDSVRNRFNWLAADDVRLKEQLLNHVRQQQKKLAVAEVRRRVQTLQRHTAEGIAVCAHSTIYIDKHQVDIWLDNTSGENVFEGRPVARGRSGNCSVEHAIFAVLGLAIFLIIVLRPLAVSA